MKELTISTADSSQRMDKYLKRVFPEMGTSFLYKMLRKKNITLNNKKATGSELVQTGDRIQCFFSDETFNKFSGNAVESIDHHNSNSKNVALSHNNLQEYIDAYQKLSAVSIIYEDEHILLANKPAGVLSQKAKNEDLSLNEWLLGYLLNSGAVSENSLKHFKPSICNRLDRNTSGLVICGKTLLGSREMSRMLKDRSLKKYYRTYVHGKLEGSQILEGYHYKDKGNNQAHILFEKPVGNLDKYDTIITAYHSLEMRKMYSYLEIELITGKTHQIRAHLSAYGHSIVGDTKYGSKKVGANAGYPKYQLLHAYRIEFPNIEGELSYLSGKEFICKEPKEFTKFKNDYFNK